MGDMKVLIDHRHACAICHENNCIQIHHIIPRSEGGSDDDDNKVVLCLKHHNQAHQSGGFGKKLSKEHLKEYRRKWIEECKTKSPNYKIIKIYIPKTYNDGKQIEANSLKKFCDELISFFHGYTFNPHSHFNHMIFENIQNINHEIELYEIEVITPIENFQEKKATLSKVINRFFSNSKTSIFVSYEDINFDFY